MRFGIVVALLVVPATAFAGDMANALGFAGQWSASTLGYARSLFPAVLLVGLVLEIVFRDPSTPPSFRNTLWRGAIVFTLLVPVGGHTLYSKGCGVLAGVSDGLTAALAPADPWAQFAQVAEQWQTKLAASKAADEDGSIAAQLGGFVFTSLLSIALLLGQGSLWVMTQLAAVLTILLYALGPLALVFWVPVKSDSLGRWLRTFLTVLTWPVMSAVILGIITRASLKGLDGASPAFASIAMALLLGVTALAVPVVSSSLVGGSMGAVGAGVATLMQTAGLGTAAASAAVGGGVRGLAAGVNGASEAAGGGLKGLQGAMGGVLQSDFPLSDGPPAKGGPRGAGNLVPNAIDAAPLHGAPAVASDGLGLLAPPPPPKDAFSGRLEAVPPGPAFAGHLGTAAAPPAAPHGGDRLPSAVPPLPPPPPGHAALTEPVRPPRPAGPKPAPNGLAAPTSPAMQKPPTWNETIERLGHQALALEHAPDGPARSAALQAANAKLDRAVKALDAGLSVQDWVKTEPKG